VFPAAPAEKQGLFPLPPPPDPPVAEVYSGVAPGFPPDPLPPPVDVIVEKIEGVPEELAPGEPVPPPPTVTGTDIDPNPVNVIFVPPGNEVR
jgi:hypothetical protein